MASNKLPRNFMGGAETVKYFMGVDLAKPNTSDKSMYCVWFRRADGCHMLIDEGVLDATTPQGIEDQIKAIASQFEGITIMEEKTN